MESVTIQLYSIYLSQNQNWYQILDAFLLQNKCDIPEILIKQLIKIATSVFPLKGRFCMNDNSCELYSAL